MWFPNKALVSFESCNQYENFLKWCESVGITDGCGGPFYVEWRPDLCLRIQGHVIKSFASTAYYRTPGGSGGNATYLRASCFAHRNILWLRSNHRKSLKRPILIGLDFCNKTVISTLGIRFG